MEKMFSIKFFINGRKKSLSVIFSDLQHFYVVILSLKNQNSKTGLIFHYPFLPWKIYIFIYIQTKGIVRNRCTFWVLIFQRQNHYIEMLQIWKNHWNWLFSTTNKTFYTKHFFENFIVYFVPNTLGSLIDEGSGIAVGGRKFAKI